MQLIIGSRHLNAMLTASFDSTGREHAIVIAKASWSIPAPGQRPRPLPPPEIEAGDVYLGDPGMSALLYGSDIAHFKPRCDVLFNANAHSPTGESVTELMVGWRVGPLQKGLRVVGKRHWRKRLGFVSLSDPEPFLSLPLHYGLAFGGSGTYTQGRGERETVRLEFYPTNPAGIGWLGRKMDLDIDGAPAPSLEALDDPISRPTGEHKAAAFSAVGRHWEPRVAYAGTYDEIWQQDVFPFLPEDFDPQHNQCAPVDQQMPYPTGGEDIVLRHMMAGRPNVRFKLPRLDRLEMSLQRTNYRTERLNAVVDTLYFEPDQERFTVVWRASTPLKTGSQEIKQVEVALGDIAQLKRTAARAGGCVGCGG